MANIPPRLRSICLELPEAEEEVVGVSLEHAKYTVRGKVFVRFHDSHHGDGVVGIICKAPPGMQSMLVESDPIRFFVPSYSGHRGDIGMRLDAGQTDWEQVRDVVTESYRTSAPKALLVGLT
jgi:hypothetical protein